MIGVKPDSPMTVIKNTSTGEVRELHRNMYPLRMVDRNDEGENATPVLAKANVVTDIYFACDCRNCRDSLVQDRGGYPCKLDNCHSKCKTRIPPKILRG